MVDFHNISVCPPEKLPANPRDITVILTILVEADDSTPLAAT
jgi:ferritin-like protein